MVVLLQMYLVGLILLYIVLLFQAAPNSEHKIEFRYSTF